MTAHAVAPGLSGRARQRPLSGWRARARHGVRRTGLLRGDIAGDISSDPEGCVTCVAMLMGGQAIAAELEMVVDAGHERTGSVGHVALT